MKYFPNEECVYVVLGKYLNISPRGKNEPVIHQMIAISVVLQMKNNNVKAKIIPKE